MITKSLQFSVRGFGILLLAQSILFAMGTAGPAQAGEAVPWVSAMEGKPDTLSLKHEGGEWFQATLNTPITKGDDLWLEAGGRAEVFLDGSSYIRLSGPASLRFDTLQDLSFDVAQNVGQAQFQTGPDTEVFLVTPNLGLTIHANTRARLNVADDESTDVTTLQGQVELNGPAGYAAVNEGQSLYLGAGSDNYSLSGAPPPDDFDRWSERRDRKLASVPPTPAPAAQYLSPPAASSLSSNGQWYNDLGYGWVWRPSVPPNWSPYTVGHWGWWPGWGWTWIPSEPWGWYPYHYGNWVVGGAGWFWVPGPIVSVGWNPALVFWLDGPDYIGWAPLPFGVDIVLFQREVDRDPGYVYQYVHQNNITVVNVNNFNSTNYVNVRRSLPANYQSTARFAANSQHEFRGIHNVHEFESASGPRGWVPKDRRPPERLSNRVAPAWESNGRPDRGLHQDQNKGEQPGRVVERPLPPGRGKDRTPPARNPAAGEERRGRGPGQAAPPGQLKERPEAPGHPGREKGIEAPTGPGKERPDRPTPPGREDKSLNQPSGEIKKGPERPTPPGREGKSLDQPSGQNQRGPAARQTERPTPPGREGKSLNQPSGENPRGPEAKPPERATPPGREERPSGGAVKERPERPTPPGRQQAPSAPAPEPPKPPRGQTPSKPAGASPAAPAPAPEPNKPSKKKKNGAFLYSPPGRERWLAESSGFMDRAQRNTLSPRFAPPGWNARLAETASRPQARNDSSSLRFSPPNRDHLGAATSGVADSSQRDAGLRWLTPRGERTNSSWAGSPNRPQLSRSQGSSPVFSRPSFGGNSRSSFRAPAPSRPSFSGGSSFSHRGGSGGSSPSSAGRSSAHFSGSRGTTPKGR